MSTKDTTTEKDNQATPPKNISSNRNEAREQLEKKEKDDKTGKFDKLKNTQVTKPKEARKPKEEPPKKVNKILEKLSNKNKSKDVNKKTSTANTTAKPAQRTNVNKDKNLDAQKYQRELAAIQKRNQDLANKVKEYQGEKTKAQLSVSCQSIFEDVGIIESARKDLLEVIYQNFSLSNGRLIKTGGGKADIAGFLRNYVKDREHLTKPKRGSSLKGYSESSKLNRSSGNNSVSSSFRDYKESLPEKRNKR